MSWDILCSVQDTDQTNNYKKRKPNRMHKNTTLTVVRGESRQLPIPKEKNGIRKDQEDPFPEETFAA